MIQKWLPIDQMFKINKLGLLKKGIDGRAQEYLITNTNLNLLRFDHKYSSRAKTSPGEGTPILDLTGMLVVTFRGLNSGSGNF